MFKKVFLVLLLFILGEGLGLAETESLELNLFLQRLTFPQAPFIFNNLIVFSYAAPVKTIIVAARFSHENYTVLHAFRRNESNLFVLTIPLPKKATVIKYRLMVDGVWTYDPVNPAQEMDEKGIVYSVFNYTGISARVLKSPNLLGEGYVEFVYKTKPGSTVMLAGSFNGYDPFSLFLKEIEPGLYKIKVKLLRGIHYYYFVDDGISLPDPLNPELAENKAGQRFSIVKVK